MKGSLKFLIKINGLKTIPRTGWVLRKVKNPETIAEHIFRVAIVAWFLSQEKKLNVRRAVKIALSHDLCEIYAGDLTPFFYYLDLPKAKKEREKILMKWVRLSKKEKVKRGEMKFQIEKKGLLKLVKFLDPEIKKDIISAWLDYEKGISREGRFVKQLDKIETLVQAIEYFGPGATPAISWWEEVEELVEDPFLLEFLHVIQNKFYGRFHGYKKRKNLERILDCILEIGKLKKMPRLYWLIRKVKKPETIAGHIFTVTIMAWIFGWRKKNLNQGRLLKMALCHEMTALHTGDSTPYDGLLPEDEKEIRKILRKFPRLLGKEKARKFFLEYKKEKGAILKLTRKLEPQLKKEIFQLWEEYRKRNTPESRFLTQLNTLAVLLEGLLYRRKKKGFSVSALWEWAFEVCDDPLPLSLMAEMKKEFY